MGRHNMEIPLDRLCTMNGLYRPEELREAFGLAPSTHILDTKLKRYFERVEGGERIMYRRREGKER